MRTRKLQLAAFGVHCKKSVPEQAIAKQRRKPTLVSLMLYVNESLYAYQ
jgi:hypothetical protein